MFFTESANHVSIPSGSMPDIGAIEHVLGAIPKEISVQGGSVNINWESSHHCYYRVEYSESLTDGDWNDVSGLLRGTGDLMNYVHVQAGNPDRGFYKVMKIGLHNKMVFSDEHYGLAGFSPRDNEYSINVDTIGFLTILKAWFAQDAAGHPTQGTITLTPHSKNPSVIAKWKQAQVGKIDENGNVARDPQLKPLEIDISKYVSTPGLYKVRFDYGPGPGSAIGIFQVDIDVWRNLAQ